MATIYFGKFKIAGFLLVIILLSGCGRKKKSTTCVTEELVTSDLPLGPNDTLAQASIFNEDIEAFVLEEDQPAFNQQLAQNQLDFTWEEHDLKNNKKQVVYFDYDSSKIKPDQEAAILADIQEKRALTEKGYNVSVIGHSCKWHGTKAYNLALSERRAQSIADYYEKAGIDRKHIKVIGVGDSEPITLENGKEAQAPNRRVEISALC